MVTLAEFEAAMIPIVIVALIMLAGIVTRAHAAVINVPGDEPTIQAAIDVAQPGDIVLIAPGSYEEQFDTLGKTITIRGADARDPTAVSLALPPAA